MQQVSGCRYLGQIYAIQMLARVHMEHLGNTTQVPSCGAADKLDNERGLNMVRFSGLSVSAFNLG